MTHARAIGLFFGEEDKFRQLMHTSMADEALSMEIKNETKFQFLFLLSILMQACFMSWCFIFFVLLAPYVCFIKILVKFR